jgi:hypothetical protein
MAPFPSASFAAMIPEPTTAASKNAVPSHSENARFLRDGISSVLWPLPLRLP